jgi:lysophospholipase
MSDVIQGGLRKPSPPFRSLSSKPESSRLLLRIFPNSSFAHLQRLRSRPLSTFLVNMRLSFHIVVNFLFYTVILVTASPVPRTLTPYAPVPAICPSSPLVRPATGISSSESSYISQRYTKASTALAAFLKSTNAIFSPSQLPVVALTTSGGGYRSLLTGAGVIQAFDSRDSQTGVSGLFQGLTYQAGLSGGGWLLSSFAGNNYPTISSLRDNLWEAAFQNSLLAPGNLLVAGVAYGDILADIRSKDAAGYPPTLTDPWGRLLSYQLLQGSDGGASDTLSGITALSNFTRFNVPYPILTALGVKTFEGECLPGPDATQYELHPYEFGSWDTGVNAFTQTHYLGTKFSNGVPSSASCERNYDNLGYVLGRCLFLTLIFLWLLIKPTRHLQQSLQ